MLKRLLAAALCCAALLLASAPPALAQALRGAAAGRDLTAPSPDEAPRLKALVAESVARARAGALTEGDFRRYEKIRQEEAQKQPEGGKWSTRKKVLMIVAIAGGVALIAWATANAVDDPTPFCDTDPSDPNCIP